MKHSFVWFVPLVTLIGCAAPPMPDELGIPRSIEYRTEGEPLDIADALPDALTVPEAVVEAIGHDPSLQAALARLRLAMAEARQRRLLPNPALSIVARFPEGGGSPTIEAGLTAELLALLGRPRQISAADHRLRAAGGEVLTVALDLVEQTQERFITIQSIDAELASLRQRLELINRLRVIAEARVELGESSRLDVLTFDTERIRVESEVLDAEARERDARLALSRLLGRPSREALWTITPWTPPADVGLEERALIESALQHRPEVQSRRWELSARGDEAALASWGLLEGGDAGIDAERDDGNWSIGPAVALPLPIFDFGQARRERATAAQVEARHELVLAQRRVVEEVRRAATGVRLSQQSLAKVRDELIPVLQQRHDQAQAAYRIGEADITTVLLAEQELQLARSRLIELQQRVAMAHIRLTRAVGQPVSIPNSGSKP